jgi:hypothetical protein
MIQDYLESERARMSTEADQAQAPGRSASDRFASNPKIVQILQWLREDGLLVEPTLRFLALRRAQVARAKLDILYTSAEQAELRAEMKL